jgi:hypothetical protein
MHMSLNRIGVVWRISEKMKLMNHKQCFGQHELFEITIVYENRD